MVGPVTSRRASVVTAPLLAAVMLAAVSMPQPGRAAVTSDPLVAPDATGSGVVAIGGQVSWVRRGGADDLQPVLLAGGGVRDLPAAAHGATFGLDSRGHPTLVYGRRTEKDRVSLQRFDTAAGVETPAAAPPAVGRGCDVIGAVSGRLLAYALTGDGPRCKRLIRVVGANGRVLLTRRDIAATSIALDQRNLAVGSGEWSLRLRAIDLRTHRSAVVARNDANADGGAGTITRPTFAAGRLYFAMTSINASGTSGSTLGPFRVVPGVKPACAISTRSFGANVLLDSFAVDPPHAYYADGEHVRRTSLADLRFGGSRKGPC